MTATTVDHFADLVGQNAVKRKLKFYIEAFSKTGRIPHLFFNAPKGTGKTEFSRSLARALNSASPETKPLVEINASTIRNNEVFFNQIFLQHVHDRYCTVFFDEAHALPKDLTQALLTILNPTKDSYCEFSWGESNFHFDFTKVSFVLATTEGDKIFGPLKDRLSEVDFKPYKNSELCEIMLRYTPDIKFEEDVLESDVVQTVRGNPRQSIKRAGEINYYCERALSPRFGKKQWEDLCHQTCILPYGLTYKELSVLKALSDRGPCTLQMLANVTGLSRTALQRDTENYPLSMGFMKIDSKRMITGEGEEVIKSAKALDII